MSKKYNKLVRDCIPEILSDGDYLRMLDAKRGGFEKKILLKEVTEP